jgi:hypothetical protein
LDPALLAPGQRSLFVEDELPWFRFQRLIDTYRDLRMNPWELLSRRGIERLCVAAGLARPRDVIERASQALLLGPDANWDPVRRLNHVRYLPATYLERVWLEPLDWFRRSHRAHADAWRAGGETVPDLPDGPVLYDDVATIRLQSTEDDASFTEVMRWRQRLFSTQVRGFIEGRPVDTADDLAPRVVAGLEAIGIGAGEARETVDAFILDRLPYGTPSLTDVFQPAVITNSLQPIY